MKRQRYQRGHLWLRKGKRTKAWYLRYRGLDGASRLEILGTLAELPTRTEARKAADRVLEPVNGGRPRREPATGAMLIARYRTVELPERRSTRAAYGSLLSRHIEPRWRAVLLDEVRPADVEAWLRELPLSPKTKANLRQLLHVLFECGRRWEMATENPITLVRQSAKRSRELVRVSVSQYRALVAALIEPHRTMVLIAGCLGLRIGEILGLRWGDVDFERATMTVRRDVYQGHVDEVKTANSARILPVPATVLESLRTWRMNAHYQGSGEFVFAQDNGRPMWADTARERVLQPVALGLGLGKIGWHALRHLFASVLQVVGAEPVVAQELMGHADRRTTEGYQYGFDDRKRAATDNVAALLGPVQ